VDGARRARFDLVAGTVSVEGYEGPFSSWQSHVWARDSCRIAGSTGPTVTVIARLHLAGRGDAAYYADPHGTVMRGAVPPWGVLRAAEGPVDSARFDASPNQPVTVSQDLQVTLQHAPGEWFALTLSASVGMSFGGGNLEGRLSFEMPPSDAVESCQGCAGATSVPAQAPTWGALKARHR